MKLRTAAARLFVVSALMPWLLPGASTRSWASGGDAPLYDSRIADIITATKFPDHGAVVLIDRRIHTWSFDQTAIERVYALKILTHEGVERFGNFISDVYHNEYHASSITATVVSPLGERNKVGSGYIKKVESGNDVYQYRVALPGVEIGSIIEIDELVESKYAITSGRWNFSCRVPTLRSELVFRIPAGALAVFNFTPKHSRISPISESDGRYETYTITVEVVSPYTDEPYMPARYIGNPTVYYHIWQVTMEDYLRFRKIEYDDYLLSWLEEKEIPWELPLGTRSWREIAASFTEYFDPETWKDDDGAEEYRSMLRSIAGGLLDSYTSDMIHDLDALLASFHQQFHSMDRPLIYRNPEESLDKREGDSFQLAYVLKQILAEQNIETSIVIASDASLGMLDERNPDPYMLRHPLLVFTRDAERYWIDPFAAECGVNQLPWEYQGVKALWLKPDSAFSFITTPLDAATANCISSREEIGIDTTGRLSCNSNITLTGQYLLHVRRSHDIGASGENGADVLNFIDRRFPERITMDNETIELNAKDTLIVSFRYSIEKFGTHGGDFMNLDFTGWFETPEFAAFGSETREHEIMFPFAATRSFTLRIDIPENYAVLHQPRDVKHEDEWFTYIRSCRQKDGRLLLERTFAITSPKVDARDYEKAGEAVESIREFDRESIVLKQRL